MAKIKNKKRLSADKIYQKRETAQSKKKLNPFEVHINKEKLRVLGKKQKNDRGVPGISRAKAITKRKHTLLQEYNLQNRSNKFMDKRIGERSNTLSEADRVLARFTAIRVKAHSKKSIFNLADDEVLTHKGQTLSEIEKFEDPRSDDEESDNENKSGNLEANFIREAHFGGGVLSKTGKEGAKTHKELINQLIEESKKRKVEMQKAKEATLELTEKLNTEWKDLVELVSKNKKTTKADVEKTQIDDYDKVMRELRFEARGTVSDRLKTENEVANEEKEKLEQLEKERLDRMKGVWEATPSKPTHRSADDLEDDFVFDLDSEPVLSYNKEGESNVLINAEINGKNVKEFGVQEAEEESKQGQSESGKTDSESEDDLSDLKEDSNEESDVEEKVKLKSNSGLEIVSEKTNKAIKILDKVVKQPIITEFQDQIKLDLQHRKEIMDQARKELPYTFALPDSYEGLLKCLDNQPNSHQSVILERMIKCNHPSLAEVNKDGLGLLFAYLLQYLNDLFSEATDEKSLKTCFEGFITIMPQIFDLAQLNKESAHNGLIAVMKEKHEEFRKKPKSFPGYEILMFLKMISLLFSTSDFRHQLVTPCLVFIEQMLTKCKVQNQRDISYGLFLVTIFLEYTTLSKRYLPAVLRFLAGLLHMAIPKSTVKLIKVVPPFKSLASDLVLVEDCSAKIFKKTNIAMNITDLLVTKITSSYQIKTIYCSLCLITEFIENYKTLPSNVEIFQQIMNYLLQIPVEKYPTFVRSKLSNTLNVLKQIQTDRKLNYIVMEAKKPKALRLYEPKIEEVFETKRRKVQSREKAERDKLIHKLKKETKGALREIRRDKAFLGRVKINQRIQSDRERRAKVNKIYAEAASQQSELNAMDRKKKKK